MSTRKHIDGLCCAVIAAAVALMLLILCTGLPETAASASEIGYESRIFNTERVHTVDIVMDDWDEFIAGCEDEEYKPCSVVIDGEAFDNIALRAKGNTSLSSVRSMGSSRYSFKLEFDHYEDGKSFHGLDKLCLNNLIQDNTMMKDYVVYTLMNDFGVDAPLCSFAWITVNGEDWGLYLAVEGVEDSFLARRYGSDAGELYKPDSTGFGGGRGNGRQFSMGDFEFDGLPERGLQQPPEMPEGAMPAEGGKAPQQLEAPNGGRGGMGSDAVKLKYIDDNPESYADIFDNAKTDVSEADKARLIASLRSLSEYEDLENVLDTEEVLRYFVVHNFVCNGDSYTGAMIHNYYLHEADGRLSMIPWDYNLAFGAFQGGAEDAVNADVDNPVSGGDNDDRPMAGWIFSDEGYLSRYHELFEDFLRRWFSDGELDSLIADTAELIEPYVRRDPTKFCTEEEFQAGVSALESFVSLRAEAVSGSLEGDGGEVDTSGLNLADMGGMERGGAKFGGDGDPSREIPERGEMPNGGFTRGGADEMPNGDLPQGEAPQAEQSGGAEGAILLLACFAALAVGIGIAIKVKH